MKKISVLAIAVLMIAVGLFTAFPAAANTSVSSMAEALVVHYDFSGATLDEALRDKAYNDSVSDDLVLYSGKSAEGTSFAINEAYSASAVPTDSENFAKAMTWDSSKGTMTAANSASLQAKSSNETKTLLSSESTIVLHFYTGMVPSDQNSFLVSLASSTGDMAIIFELGFQVEGKMFLRARTPNGQGGTNFTKLCYPLKDKWYTVAITISEDIDNGKISFGGAMNFNGESNWTAISATAPTYGKNTDMCDVAPLSLFALAGGSGNNYATIDDFRLYNRALNSDEIELLGFSNLPKPTAATTTTTNDPSASSSSSVQNGFFEEEPSDTTDATTTATAGFTYPDDDEDEDTSEDNTVANETTAKSKTTKPSEKDDGKGCGASVLGTTAVAIAVSSFAIVPAIKKKRSK